MSDEVPDNLKKAAIFQLVSGLINFFVMPAAIWGFASVCGMLTFGLGGLCGFASCILWPVGILEIIAGGMGLANPKSAGGFMKIVSYVEMAGILGGGVISAVVGFMTMSMLADDEVTTFLEG